MTLPLPYRDLRPVRKTDSPPATARDATGPRATLCRALAGLSGHRSLGGRASGCGSMTGPARRTKSSAPLWPAQWPRTPARTGRPPRDCPESDRRRSTIDTARRGLRHRPGRARRDRTSSCRRRRCRCAALRAGAATGCRRTSCPRSGCRGWSRNDERRVRLGDEIAAKYVRVRPPGKCRAAAAIVVFSDHLIAGLQQQADGREAPMWRNRLRRNVSRLSTSGRRRQRPFKHVVVEDVAVGKHVVQAVRTSLTTFRAARAARRSLHVETVACGESCCRRA